MTSRQKITIGAFAIVVLVIIWQVVGLMGGGSKPATTAAIKPVAKPAGQMAATSPTGTPAMQTGPNAPSQAGAPTQAQIPAQPSMREVPVSLNAQIVELQKQTEQKFVDQLNQLQTLRVQREIAETNQAIATAKLATVTAEKSVSDILTKPSQPQYPTFAGGYAAPASTTNPSSTTEAIPAQAPAVSIAPIEIAAYTVISVTMELGRWNAVLSLQGKMYSVSIGDVLPIDGSVVTSINKNGVVLTKDGKHRRISILSSI